MRRLLSSRQGKKTCSLLEGADQADFGAEEIAEPRGKTKGGVQVEGEGEGEEGEHDHGGEEGGGGSTVCVSDYMICFVRTDWGFETQIELILTQLQATYHTHLVVVATPSRRISFTLF